jgi:hypothetical protein
MNQSKSTALAADMVHVDNRKVFQPNEKSMEFFLSTTAASDYNGRKDGELGIFRFLLINDPS